MDFTFTDKLFLWSLIAISFPVMMVTLYTHREEVRSYKQAIPLFQISITLIASGLFSQIFVFSRYDFKFIINCLLFKGDVVNTGMTIYYKLIFIGYIFILTAISYIIIFYMITHRIISKKKSYLDNFDTNTGERLSIFANQKYINIFGNEINRRYKYYGIALLVLFFFMMCSAIFNKIA